MAVLNSLEEPGTLGGQLGVTCVYIHGYTYNIYIYIYIYIYVHALYCMYTVYKYVRTLGACTYIYIYI